MSPGVLSLLRLSLFGAVVFAAGCQDPEAFSKLTDAGMGTGSGGGIGSGGLIGSGGSGSGGFIGSGGSGSGGLIGSGGSGSGGFIGSGGSGSGGSGRGGSTTGGSGTGGRASGGSGIGGTGTGGRASGGSGTGGAGTGGRGTGGATGTGGAGGSGTGSGPCAGLCTNPIVLSTLAANSGNLGVGATCHETTFNIQGGNCGNFVAPRTFTINGTTTLDCVVGGNWPALPPTKRNGGFCFQASAGQNSFAYFVTF